MNVTPSRPRMPRPLAIIALGYVLYSVSHAITHPELAAWVRAGLGAVLVFFLLRGSRVAGMIWFICNLGAALVGVIGVVQFVRDGWSVGALIMAALVALLLWHCHYLMFNAAVRRFQGRPERNASSSPPSSTDDPMR